MLYCESPVFTRLYREIEKLSVIDCHEHLVGPECRPKYQEPIAALVNGYYIWDLHSAASGIPQRELLELQAPDVPTDEKWPTFERLWRASEHTAYARVTKLVLHQVYGEMELTRTALDRVADRLSTMDEARYFRFIEQSRIKVVLTDALRILPEKLESFLDGKKTFPANWLPVIPLPEFNPGDPYIWPAKFNGVFIQWVGGLVDRHITSLDEFLEAAFLVFQELVARGAVAMKDYSAYDRGLSFELPSTAEAEKLFNQILSPPRNSLVWPESKPLNDYLFHAYMRFARELKLPVQVHTGHVTNVYNRVDKANAALLAPVMELHNEVRFDLFHGNWPYLGDLLFLGKNYPNVALDLCWLHIIDPAYAIELMERAVLTLPHSKVHAFGGDYGDTPEFIVAHLQIARQNIAAALSNLVLGGWLEEEQALAIAKDWLFNNPNRFYNLGLDAVG